MKPSLIFAFLIFLALPALAQAGKLPNGAPEAPLTAECWPENALQALQADVPMAKKMKVTQAWIDRCYMQWADPNSTEIGALVGYIKRKYPIEQAYVKKFKLPLADGRNLRAILATKPADKPRDLVVFRCGVFCDSDANSTTYNVLMNVFENNPVHVLFLNSSSGIEYAKDNGAAHIGGFDEGYQNLEAARYVLARQAKLGLKVRRVHVMGMSLGGLATLFSSFYADAGAFPGMKFGSFVAFCPLVDTTSEFNDYLTQKNLASLVFWYRTRKIFLGLPSLLKPLEKIFERTKITKDELGNINTALELSAHYYEENWDRLAFSGYITHPRSMDRDTLIDSSNPLRYENRFSPNTVVLHATSDMLVPWANNSSKLVGWQTDRLGVLKSKKGNHCAFTESYGQAFLTHFASGLLNKPADMRRRKQPLPPSLRDFLSGQHLWQSDSRSHYQWSVEANKPYAKLRVWVFNGRDCRSQKPHYAPRGNMGKCQKTQDIKVPLTELKNFGMPALAKDESTASRMERYLNERTRLLLPNGQRAVGTQEMPRWLESQGSFDGRYGVL